MPVPKLCNSRSYGFVVSGVAHRIIVLLFRREELPMVLLVGLGFGSNFPNIQRYVGVLSPIWCR